MKKNTRTTDVTFSKPFPMFDARGARLELCADLTPVDVDLTVNAHYESKEFDVYEVELPDGRVVIVHCSN